MKTPRKIVSTIVKLLIGLGSFGIIYFRLKSDLTAERLIIIVESAATAKGLLTLFVCLLLIPVNWGIEARKWQLITAPVERISYRMATKSVYSGVCLGNLAPGRATDFVARIIFFHIENRPQITILHFIGGLFQLSVTILAGFAALLYHLRSLNQEAGWMIYTTAVVGMLILTALVLAVIHIEKVIRFLAGKISKDPALVHTRYSFSPTLLWRLISCSVLRYLVFYLQFALLLSVFSETGFQPAILPGIALYFLVTTTIPMISVLEATIRAAIAMVVFHGSGVNDSALAITSIMVWIINIIFPSIGGYIILLRQNFNFKLFRSSRSSAPS